MPEDHIPSLFQPLRIGNTEIRNRIVMAPLTRQRSHLSGVPTDLNVEYYRQRAGAGLIVSEGVNPSAVGYGYLFSPGLHTPEQVAGWKRVTDAVHERGGKIFAQIMHVGRLSDPLILPGGADPIAPSAVQPDPASREYTVTCPRPRRDYPTPRALEREEIFGVVEDYVHATRCAVEAGFDGVEVHAASGYLPMQFLSTNTNLRTDDFGGSVEGRAKFLLLCVDAMSDVAGPGYVAVKVSPGWSFHNVYDDDPVATYSYVVRELSARRIAYLQLGDYGMDWDVYGTLRPLFDGPVMFVAGFTRSRAAETVASGKADMIAFGQAYIANPDLAERYREGHDLNCPVIETYYTQGAKGYTDYPVFADADPGRLQPVDALPTPMDPEVIT